MNQNEKLSKVQTFALVILRLFVGHSRQFKDPETIGLS